MRLPKLRELGEAIKALIQGPYTADFPAKPHVPHPNFRGLPEFNQERCVGCLACEHVCPAEAIAHRDVIEENEGGGKRAKRVMIHYTDTCIFCGRCEDACIADHEGIKCSNQWELSFFDRSKAYETIEKDLQLCELCGTAIGCRDHLLWISDQLGEMSYANPTLYLSRQRGLGLVDDNILTAMGEQGHSERSAIVCARCRRQTTLTTGK